jgi:hypothetical protein
MGSPCPPACLGGKGLSPRDQVPRCCNTHSLKTSNHYTLCRACRCACCFMRPEEYAVATKRQVKKHVVFTYL